MEKFESPKNKKEPIKEDIPLSDGNILEAHYDGEENKLKRFFIKDGDGNLLEFAELKNIDSITPEMIKQIFFKKGVVLKKEEIERITRKFIKGNLDEMLDLIDENTDIEN